MKIVITGRDFSAYDSRALDLLVGAGHDVLDLSGNGFGNGTSEDEVINAVHDADIAIAGLEPYSANVIKRCKNLKLISRRGIGYDNVDLDICSDRGISVLRTVGAVEGAVAEHVMAYILHFSRNVILQNRSMQNKEWNRIMMPGAKNHTLGLIGFGGIGKEIAKRAVPFGMKVLYYCRHPNEVWENEYSVKYMPLDELLSKSDYVSINMPLTDSTKGMFDERLIGKMKKGSILINISRALITDEIAVRDAILSGYLGGAAIDVFKNEPCTDSVLAGFDNVILTPHTAPYTMENFVEMNIRSAENVLAFLTGTIEDKYRLL